jgi:transposase-like protein
MTATPSIELPAWMAEQLSQASPDLLRQMVQIFAEALMSADADAVCGAAYGQRSPDRRNIRNGYRWRGWDTRAGSIELAVPKLREGSYFPDWLLERRRRAESALVSVVATSYLLGVSTRRMEKLVQTLGITGLSKSQVSEMAKDLDSQVEAFRTRPLDAGPYTFVAADALVLKVREAGRTVNVHALLATGVNADGYREILGLHVTSAEDGAGWLAFFRDLTAPRPHRRQVGDLRRAPRPGRGDRRHSPRRRLAAMPHPLRGQPHVGHTEERLGLGESAVALGL